MASARPVNPEAYDAYLKGMQHWYGLTPQDLDTALGYFELALKKDPNYAPAYAGIGLFWFARLVSGYTQPREGIPKGKAAILRALELDSTLVQAHVGLARVNEYEWDLAGAEVEYKRAFALNPNDPVALIAHAQYLMGMKRPEEGLAEIQRALEVDPFNAYFQATYAMGLMSAGRYDEAIVQRARC